MDQKDNNSFNKLKMLITNIFIKDDKFDELGKIIDQSKWLKLFRKFIISNNDTQDIKIG